MARALSVLRGRYFTWRAREASKRVREDEKLVAEIRCIQEKVAKYRYGSPRKKFRDCASDATYIATAEGWLYPLVIIDLYNRRVVGRAVSESPGTTTLLQTFDSPLRGSGTSCARFGSSRASPGRETADSTRLSRSSRA